MPSASPEFTFWFYVKEHLNRHELQRFYSLRHISSELGRGRAWMRCALNEHSLERYLHTLLADRPRLGLVRCRFCALLKPLCFIFCFDENPINCGRGNKQRTFMSVHFNALP